MGATANTFSPQTGFQMDFLSSPADIVIGGGAAGAGKTVGLLIEPLRWALDTKGFNCVMFRRTMPQIRNPDGLWDTSTKIYNQILKHQRPSPKEQGARWVFPSGATVKFAHMQHEKDKETWQGSGIALLCFDELTHFTASMFWYMVTRNRSGCGVPPYIRCTCNPQGRGWVKDLIQWWLYPDDYHVQALRGLPIPERAGVIRYLARYKGKAIWGDTPQEVIDQIPADRRKFYIGEEGTEDGAMRVKSFTFIPGKLTDNQALLKVDPGYPANLLAQDEELAMQLLEGRWLSEPGADELFHYNSIWDLFSNTFVPGGEPAMTCDVALQGVDYFRIFVWSGWRVEHIYSYAKSDGPMVYRQIEQIARRHGVPQHRIVIDCDGIGGVFKGYFARCLDYRANAACVPVDGKVPDFENFKTQCAYYAAKKVNNYEMYINMENADEQQIIVDELDAHRKGDKTAKNKSTITPKDEVKAVVGHSPDYADCTFMRAALDLRRPLRGWTE